MPQSAPLRSFADHHGGEQDGRGPRAERPSAERESYDQHDDSSGERDEGKGFQARRAIPSGRMGKGGLSIAVCKSRGFLLQVLEEVCQKQGYNADDYDIK